MNKNNLIIGTMRWGSWGVNFSTKDASIFLNKLYENNFIEYDLADIYGDYTTEKLFGDALKESKIKRENLFIISKCGIKMKSSIKQHLIKSYDTSKEHIIKSVDNTLKNIKSDYLDLLLIHRPDPLLNPNEIKETFIFLKNSGKVKHFGVSNFDNFQFETLNKFYPLYTNQIEYSVTNINSLINNNFLLGLSYNIPIQIWSPMGKFFDEKFENKNLKKAIETISKKYNLSTSQLILNWACFHPSTIKPIIGTTKFERVLEFQKGLNIKISKEDWYYILEAIKNKEVD